MEVTGRKDDIMTMDKILCQPCKGDDDVVLAEGYCENCNEYFCNSCLKVHRKMTVTKNHVIKSKDDMPIVHVKADPCIQPCSKHKSEIIKYYCFQHDSVGCGDCMINDHKTCKVDLVADVSDNYADSEEFNETRTKVEDLGNKITLIKNEIQEKLKNVSDMRIKMIKEIKSYRNELNDYLDQVEATLLKEVDELNEKDVTMQTDRLHKCKALESEIHQMQQTFINQDGKVNQLFVTIKHALKHLVELNASLQQVSQEEMVDSYEFVPSKKVQDMKVSRIPLGVIHVHQEKRVVDATKTILDLKAEFVREVNVPATDESGCLITGMAMSSSSEILLIDNMKESLTIFDIQNDRIVSKYTLPSEPWDVTMIDTHTCAVTLPGAAKIIFIDTKEGLNDNKLSVKEWCRGIDYHAGKMAVSYTSHPASIEILNMNGEILNLTTFPTDESYFPNYLTFSHDGENIYTSDYMHGSLHKCSVRSPLCKRICENLKGPRGLVITKDESFLICCQADSDQLSIIDLQTKQVLSLSVTHLTSPMSILLCEKSRKMFISDETEGCSNIRLFDWKWKQQYKLEHFPL